MSATRTQVYFTEEQRQRLDALALREGKTLAWIVRAAVDAYVPDSSADLGTVLDETFGSMPEIDMPARREWDRGHC